MFPLSQALHTNGERNGPPLLHDFVEDIQGMDIEESPGSFTVKLGWVCIGDTSPLKVAKFAFKVVPVKWSSFNDRAFELADSLTIKEEVHS